MDKIPFTVYDFFAYLSSGSLLAAAVDYTFGYRWLLMPSVPAPLWVFLLVVAYLTGHVVAHVSSYLCEEHLVKKLLKQPTVLLLGGHPVRPWLRKAFPGYCRALPHERQERVRNNAQAQGVSSEPEALFQHAYAVVTQNEATQRRLDEFRNIYGFARNMVVACAGVGLLLSASYSTNTPPPTPWWPALPFVYALVMLYRYLKFYRQYAYQVLITYAEVSVSKNDE